MMISLVLTALLLAAPAEAQLEQAIKKLAGKEELSQEKIASGLKEALQVGTENAVRSTGRLDGYFGNPKIKIPMPEKLQTMEKGLRAVGQGDQVDAFVLSMNRAAERAAPEAKAIFWDAIREMSFRDAEKILNGSDTAATEYFRRKTTERLATAFRPIVSDAMNQVGVTRQYKELVGRARGIPFLKLEEFDLDDYVVRRALDGLFTVLGEEERKIRREPAARVTDLLREVFARQ